MSALVDELRAPTQIGTNIRGEPVFDTDPVRERAAEALTTLQSRLEAVEAERNGWRKIVGEIAALVPLPSVIKATGTTGDLIDWIKQQIAERDAAEARVEELQKALEPLAKAEWNEEHMHAVGLWPSHIARARALSPARTEEGKP